MQVQITSGPGEPADAKSEGLGISPGPPSGDGEIPEADLTRLIECLLFVASSPTPLAQLATALQTSEVTIEAALTDLIRSYQTDRRGLAVQRKGDRVQLTTAPEAAPYIERFLGLDLSTKLSPAALETLAVIAYRQPLTRAQIEAIRGVNCDGVMRTLVARALVEPVGRLEQAGRPFVYATTFQFLQYFGLESLEQLPPLPSEELLPAAN
jgi:segregation and condensation protein B